MIFVSGKCSDLCFVEMDGQEHDGYVPDDLGIGGGDYITIEFCLDCGQLAGKFPIKNPMFIDVEDLEGVEDEQF